MLEITVSPEIEQQLEQLAASNGEKVESFASRLLAEKIVETAKRNGDNQTTETNEKPRRNYMRMKGMFSSGKTDTSERMSDMQSLDLNLDSREGFSIK